MEPVTTIFINGFPSGALLYRFKVLHDFAAGCFTYFMYLPIIGDRSFLICSGTIDACVMMAVASASLHAHVRGPLMRSMASAIVFCAIRAFWSRFATIRSTVTESWSGCQQS